ncbi:hypothetical protein KQI65_16475 [bacterium]|nr:hypothetical protein [bacterium]
MHSQAEQVLTLRRVLLVVVLMFMLSFNPAMNTQQLRVERAAIEYVMPTRRRRRFRGRRRQREPLRFTSIESFSSL